MGQPRGEREGDRLSRGIREPRRDLALKPPGDTRGRTVGPLRRTHRGVAPERGAERVRQAANVGRGHQTRLRQGGDVADRRPERLLSEDHASVAVQGFERGAGARSVGRPGISAGLQRPVEPRVGPVAQGQAGVQQELVQERQHERVDRADRSGGERCERLPRGLFIRRVRQQQRPSRLGRRLGVQTSVQSRCDPVLELGGGLAGEGDGDDPLHRRGVEVAQVAANEQRRLARARRGGDDAGPGVQGVEGAHRSSSGANEGRIRHMSWTSHQP